jgi:phage-related protein
MPLDERGFDDESGTGSWSSVVDTPRPKPRRRWVAVGIGVLALAGLGLGVGVASAQTTAVASPATIVCPSVADKLPAVPAQAQAEVERNLALLNTQISEANQRLVSTVGQGGPAFVNNAILGPLKDKRVATIDRIAIAIGRHAAKPTNLGSLAACALDTTGATAPVTEPTVVPTSAAGGTGATTGTGGGTTAAGVGTIVCPSVADKLPAIPASAQAEVTRNLALLDTQISEANQRLVSTVGQGGPAFVDNAILGPLKDRRVATINRIATAIGRTATKPTGLAESLSTCTLQAG